MLFLLSYFSAFNIRLTFHLVVSIYLSLLSVLFLVLSSLFFFFGKGGHFPLIGRVLWFFQFSSSNEFLCVNRLEHDQRTKWYYDIMISTNSSKMVVSNSNSNANNIIRLHSYTFSNYHQCDTYKTVLPFGCITVQLYTLYTVQNVYHGRYMYYVVYCVLNVSLDSFVSSSSKLFVNKWKCREQIIWNCCWSTHTHTRSSNRLSPSKLRAI